MKRKGVRNEGKGKKETRKEEERREGEMEDRTED